MYSDLDLEIEAILEKLYTDISELKFTMLLTLDATYTYPPTYHTEENYQASAENLLLSADELYEFTMDIVDASLVGDVEEIFCRFQDKIMIHLIVIFDDVYLLFVYKRLPKLSPMSYLARQEATQQLQKIFA